MKFVSTIAIVVFCGLLSACSSLPVMNKPLDQAKQALLPPPAKTDKSDELALILTFSGGGTRAAALSYGVLEKFRDTRIYLNGKPRRLLDEVDLISSVSGGSFTSAYYGLFGDQIFSDFERKFLKKRVQSELIKLWLLSPKNWLKLVPAFFGRSDLVAQYYSEKIFKKKTFADLRKEGPEIIINATDLSLGKGFAFSDYHFSWICSDLNTYPVGRAVAASSAVPVLFSPILLQNHMGKCGFSPITWNNHNSKVLSKRFKSAMEISKYRDVNDYRYLHLVDGGVADNLGIRSLIDMVAYHNDSLWNVFKTYKMTNTKQIVFVVVNAANSGNIEFAKHRAQPSTKNVLQAVSNVQFNQFNDDTIDILRNKFPLWKKQVQQQRCKTRHTPDCKQINFHLIEVSLKDLNNKTFLENTPTSLQLSTEAVDQLRDAGKQLLDNSEAFKQLLGIINTKQ